jgi:hypothetical protein
VALKIKRSGAWADVANGNLKIRSNGAWQSANYCYIRSGGVWRDSGYRGYPLVPQSLAVSPGAAPYNWSFSQVTVQWAAPAAGGAPVDHYQVVKTDANGSWVSAVDTGATSYTFGVSNDERCQFYVQSVSAAGLPSGFIGPVRVQIGHPEVGHYANVQHNEPWNSAMVSVNLYLQSYTVTIFVPSDVLVSSWYTNLRNDTAGWAKLSPDPSNTAPPGGRRLFDVFRNAPQWTDWHNRLDVPNPWAPPWRAMNHWGENQGWGYAIDGTGYSAGPTGGFRIYGEFQIFGTRYYDVNTYFIDTNRVDNSFW